MDSFFQSFGVIVAVVAAARAVFVVVVVAAAAAAADVQTREVEALPYPNWHCVTIVFALRVESSAARLDYHNAAVSGENLRNSSETYLQHHQLLHRQFGTTRYY